MSTTLYSATTGDGSFVELPDSGWHYINPEIPDADDNTLTFEYKVGSAGQTKTMVDSAGDAISKAALGAGFRFFAPGDCYIKVSRAGADTNAITVIAYEDGDRYRNAF